MEPVEFVIGLMSGTSMDGVDAVCVRFVAGRFDAVIAHDYLPFDNRLRHRLLDLQNKQFDELHTSRILAIELTQLYAQVVRNLRAQKVMRDIEISAIGCHGQTVRHAPHQGYSIQLADWSLLSEQTRLPVVGDFRAADISAGGEGAPLVPIFHQALFGDIHRVRLIINLGGIANLTVLERGMMIAAFDSGPANMLIDAWVQEHFACAYDVDGKLAAQGCVLNDLLHQLSSDEYFTRPFPKSTGRDYFNLSWVNSRLSNNESALDVLRTLVELTAITVANAVHQSARDVDEIIVCGGGVKNQFLLDALRKRLPADVHTTDEYHLPSDQVEAAAFAYLAYCRVHRICANLPQATGSQGRRVLGALWENIPNP